MSKELVELTFARAAASAGSRIICDVDDIIAPINMNLQDALRWLENLRTEIDCRIDAIKDDIRKAGGSLR
jgi:hypothetical protein